MTKAPNPKKLIPGMIRAAHASGKVLKKYWDRMDKKSLGIREKLDAGLVTHADIESERACVKILKTLRPDFSFLTEEGTAETKKATGRWVIDPLDGTTNFVHGFPMFCVSLAAEWDGKIIAGVIYHPILQDTYVATKNGGATVNGKKLKISKTSKIEDSLLTTGFTYRKNLHLHQEMIAFEELSQVARAIRRPGSAALDLAYVARGVFDGFWERRLSPWDIAAGTLLVQEAGGIVTDFFGNPPQLDDQAILATNKKLHPALLKAVQVSLK